MSQQKLAVWMAVIGSLFANAVQAQESPLMVRTRAVFVDFQNKQSGGLPLGGSTKVEADSRWIPELDISYFFTKNIATELVLTYPQSVDIKVGGAKQGTIKALPPSLMLQYHYTELGDFKPYAGVGLNYTIFTKRSNILGGAAQVDSSSLGLAAQLGMDYMLSKNWSVNLDVKYIQMNTDVRVGGNKVGSIGLNPFTMGLGVGYRF